MFLANQQTVTNALKNLSELLALFDQTDMPSVNIPMKTMKQFFCINPCWDPLTRPQLYLLFRVHIWMMACWKDCINLQQNIYI